MRDIELYKAILGLTPPWTVVDDSQTFRPGVIRDRDAARETDRRDDGNDQSSHPNFASLPPSDHGVRPNVSPNNAGLLRTLK
jgi:hypothetical protein